MKNITRNEFITRIRKNEDIKEKYFKLIDIRDICLDLNEAKLTYMLEKKYFKRLYKIVLKRLDHQENEMENFYNNFYKQFKNIEDFSNFFGVSVPAVRKWNGNKSTIPNYVIKLIEKENELNKLKKENQILKNKLIENLTK